MINMEELKKSEKEKLEKLAGGANKSRRVVITRPIVGLCHMQVCAEKDVTDEEILEVCNEFNPSGTTNGWSHVVRWELDELHGGPVVCDDDPDRLHFLVSC